MTERKDWFDHGLVDNPIEKPVIISESLSDKKPLEELLTILKVSEVKEYDIVEKAIIINDEPHIRYALRRVK